MHTHFGSRVVVVVRRVVVIVVLGVVLGVVGLIVVGAGTTTGRLIEAACSKSIFDTQPSKNILRQTFQMKPQNEKFCSSNLTREEKSNVLA